MGKKKLMTVVLVRVRGLGWTFQKAIGSPLHYAIHQPTWRFATRRRRPFASWPEIVTKAAWCAGTWCGGHDARYRQSASRVRPCRGSALTYLYLYPAFELHHEEKGGTVVHYAFGAVMGAGYGAAAEVAPPVKFARGLP